MFRAQGQCPLENTCCSAVALDDATGIINPSTARAPKRMSELTCDPGGATAPRRDQDGCTSVRVHILRGTRTRAPTHPSKHGLFARIPCIVCVSVCSRSALVLQALVRTFISVVSAGLPLTPNFALLCFGVLPHLRAHAPSMCQMLIATRGGAEVACIAKESATISNKPR